MITFYNIIAGYSSILTAVVVVEFNSVWELSILTLKSYKSLHFFRFLGNCLEYYEASEKEFTKQISQLINYVRLYGLRSIIMRKF